MPLGLERSYAVRDVSLVRGGSAVQQQGLTPSGCWEGRELAKAEQDLQVACRRGIVIILITLKGNLFLIKL